MREIEQDIDAILGNLPRRRRFEAAGAKSPQRSVENPFAGFFAFTIAALRARLRSLDRR